MCGTVDITCQFGKYFQTVSNETYNYLDSSNCIINDQPHLPLKIHELNVSRHV